MGRRGGGRESGQAPHHPFHPLSSAASSAFVWTPHHAALIKKGTHVDTTSQHAAITTTLVIRSMQMVIGIWGGGGGTNPTTATVGVSTLDIGPFKGMDAIRRLN